MDALSDQGQLILELERSWWRRRMPKGRLIRERLGVSSTRYHQMLNSVIDEPGALAYDPVLVGRLRRLREARRRVRFGGIRRGEL
jgi:hypothetical protein